jgi:two-component system chemotaxis response regulator CheY
MRVLIVDDSPEMRTIVATVLEAVGFEVDQAKDGLDGLSQYIASEPDMIITDINMPFMDGLAFVERVREEPDGGRIPIFVMSSDGCPAKRARADRCGVRQWMEKPVNVSAMASALMQAAAIPHAPGSIQAA